MGISMNSRLIDGPRRTWCLVLLLALCSCQNKGGEDLPSLTRPGTNTRFQLLLSPERKVDILFMVDNSSSMDPKQEALAKAFPKMIETLQKTPGGLPDLRIGVISSDMGAGIGDGPAGCSVLGNQGILWGNDPDSDPDSQNNKYATIRNIKSSAGDDGCGMSSGARWIEDILKGGNRERSKNYKGDLGNVFSCLAKAVGVNGCPYEHQLQSLRLALNPIQDINPQNFGFVRRNAYLAIVLLSDEDDCSAEPDTKTNDDIFLPGTPGDTSSLRCAARGHVCNGQSIPSYEPDRGYTGDRPFVTKLSDCDAKDDSDGNSRDYKKLPLIRIRDMIDSVERAKIRPEQILATGIIGWPKDGKLDGAEYRIDKDPTAVSVEQQKLWDYMPICMNDSVKSLDGNTYKAYGGLRLKKFLDAFKDGDRPNLFSICNPDFSDAMIEVGKAIGRPMLPGCINYPLADTDAARPGIQAECSVTQNLHCDTYGSGSCRADGYEATAIRQCRDDQGNLLDLENPQTDKVSSESRPCWYLHRDVSEFGCTQAPWSLSALVLTRNGERLPPGTFLEMNCMTCPDGQAGCQVEH